MNFLNKIKSAVNALEGANKVWMQTDKPTYCAGETVTGVINLSIVMPITTSGLFIKLEGFERTKFQTKRTEHVQQSDGTSKMVTHIDNHSAHRMLIRHRMQIPGMPLAMIPGQFSFPFSFQLPNGIPGVYHNHDKYQNLPYEASVFYRLEAFVDGIGFSSDMRCSQPLIINQALLSGIKASTALKTANAMFLCCINKGEITMGATFDKNAYIPGESANIVCAVDNKSEVDVGSINVKLMRKTILRAGNKSITDIDTVFGHKYPGIEKGKKYWGGEARLVPLTIPGNVQPGTQGGKLVHCEYWVDVECDIAWAPDIELHMPITVYAPTLPLAQWQMPQPEGWNPVKSDPVVVEVPATPPPAGGDEPEPTPPPEDFKVNVEGGEPSPAVQPVSYAQEAFTFNNSN